MKKPLSDYGNHMTLEEWDDAVSCGAFIPSDGCGYYATATEEDSDFSCWKKRPEWATHVMWYNK